MTETETVQLEHKLRMTSELTSRFENMQMCEIDYLLASKLKKWKQTIRQ